MEGKEIKFPKVLEKLLKLKYPKPKIFTEDDMIHFALYIRGESILHPKLTVWEHLENWLKHG